MPLVEDPDFPGTYFPGAPSDDYDEDAVVTGAPVPDLLRAAATIDGEQLALALVAASEHPEWVDQIVQDAPAELLRDALRFLAVNVVGGMLDQGQRIAKTT